MCTPADDWMASTGMAGVEATEAEIALDTMFSKAQQGIIMVFLAEIPREEGRMQTQALRTCGSSWASAVLQESWQAN